MSSDLVPQQPSRPRDRTAVALQVVQNVQSAVAEWRQERAATVEAWQGFKTDLPAYKALVERLAGAPASQLDDDLRAVLIAPIGYHEAFKACVRATMSLAGPQSAEHVAAYVADLAEVAMDAEATAGELALVRRWLRSRSGSPGRPAKFGTFTWRPHPGEFDELLHEARRQIRAVLDAVDKRNAHLRKARALLEKWPAFEAGHTEARRLAILEEQAATLRYHDRLTARQAEIQRFEMAKGRRRPESREERLAREATVREVLERRRASEAAKTPEERAHDAKIRAILDEQSRVYCEAERRARREQLLKDHGLWKGDDGNGDLGKN